MKDPAIVYRWLAEIDRSSQQIAVFRTLAEQVRQALENNQLIRAKPALESLQLFTEMSGDPFLFFEGRLILALAAHRMLNYRQALTFLDQALKRINGYQPHTAIARWMQGCAYFASMRAAEGIFAWYNSVREFQFLALEPGTIPLGWIQRHGEEMRAALENEANKLGGPPAGFTGTTARTKPPQPGSQPSGQPPGRTPPHPASPAPRQEKRPPTRNLIIQIPSIHAGNATLTQIDAQSPDLFQIDQLLINNQPFNIQDIPGSSTPSVLKLNQLFIFHVQGDSMNQAGIEDGDYVLIRQQQTAANQDIVVIEITGDEYEATIKRFQFDGSKKRVLFQPESDNPQHKTYEFYNGTDTQRKYRILGVVVGVLKKQAI